MKYLLEHHGNVTRLPDWLAAVWDEVSYWASRATGLDFGCPQGWVLVDTFEGDVLAASREFAACDCGCRAAQRWAGALVLKAGLVPITGWKHVPQPTDLGPIVFEGLTDSASAPALSL